jgi:hypothetical protein
MIRSGMVAKMKAYAWHDGRMSHLVAARSQKAAAAAFQTSVYDLRQFGGDPCEDDEAVALAQPGVVFRRSITSRDPWQPKYPPAE